MSSKCTVSVVIAAFNAAEVISHAIDSIIAQSLAPDEIIVIDDGSSDATREAVERHGGMVRYFRQENAGVSAARNAGAERASGEWLIFLDVDDRYYTDRIKKLCDFVSVDAKVDFVVGNYHFVRPEGGILSEGMEQGSFGKSVKARCGNSGVTVLEGEEIGSLVSEYFGHTLSIAIRREMFLAMGGFPVGYRVGEDLHLLIRLCGRSKRIGVICDPLGAYVVHDQGLVRADTVFAQAETVRTLRTLRHLKSLFPGTVWHHYCKTLRAARHDWAVSLLRQGDRTGALRAVFPCLYESPGWASIRTLLSVLKG